MILVLILALVAMEIATENVLVIGEAGAGKTTLTNALCGSSFKTCDTMEGCTTSQQIGTYKYEGKDIKIFDIVGLSGAGKVDQTHAIRELLRTIRAIGGKVSLVLFVVRDKRWLEAQEKNLELAMQLTDANTPFIFVVNSRDLIRNVEEDSLRYQNNLSAMGVKCEGVVVGKFAGDDKMYYEEEFVFRDESVAKLKRKIANVLIPENELVAKLFPTDCKGIGRTVVKIWNTIFGKLYTAALPTDTIIDIACSYFDDGEGGEL